MEEKKREKKELNVNIKINGTMADANLIKRCLTLFLPVANKTQSDSIKTYLMLINHAITRAQKEAGRGDGNG